jgi:hypothetical protein
MKPDPKRFSWQCLLGEISFIPDHDLSLMLTKFFFLMINIGSSD